MYQEPMLLLCHKDSCYRPHVSLSELNPAEEIFLRWNTDFDVWHEQHWPGNRYRMRIAIGAMVADYLTVPGRWSIVPASSAHILTRKYPLRACTLTSPPPKRTCYQIEHRYPRPSRITAIEQWKALLRTFIHEHAAALGIEPLV